MPTFHEYLAFAWVHVGFAVQVGAWGWATSTQHVRSQWPQYRCNPLFWIFSSNMEQDFTYCVQTTQTNMMGGYLQPLAYLVSSLASVGLGTANILQDFRLFFTQLRDLITDLIRQVFGVFFNLVVECQKMILSIQDTVGKLLGVVVSLLYVLDGSVKTMNSAWNGPPGQLVQAIGSCFHPNTPIRIADGSYVAMHQLQAGQRLWKGDSVFAVLSIANVNREGLYSLPAGTHPPVWVTGSHFVRHEGSWKQVCDHPEAQYHPTDIVPTFSCLITHSRRICVGPYLFWDWEDDVLRAYTSRP
jgi:hypothetical protein